MSRKAARSINAGFILYQSAFEDIYGSELFETVAAEGCVLGTPITVEQLNSDPPEWIQDMEVLFTGWGGPRLDEKMLARMPRLRAVFYGAGSLRSTVTDACWARRIVFCNAAAMNAIPTSEFAFGMILISLKRVMHHAAAARAARKFPRHLPLPGGFGSTIGIMSLGQIGRRVAERALTLDVQVVAYDPFLPQEVFENLGVNSCELDELFACSDVISIHTPLLPSTTGLVNGALLARLKTNATLINTARGGIINQPELIEFLRTRTDVQAILDVTEPEPPSTDSPLWDLPNVFLTPHIAGSLGPECRRMGRAMVEEFRRFIRDEPLLHSVTREGLGFTA